MDVHLSSFHLMGLDVFHVLLEMDAFHAIPKPEHALHAQLVSSHLVSHVLNAILENTHLMGLDVFHVFLETIV